MSRVRAEHVAIQECGDAAIRVEAASSNTEDNWLTVHGLANWLEECGAEGILAAVPTYDSVLVEFDPFVISARQVRAFVGLGLRDERSQDGTSPREFVVPVVYGGSFGPDLERVAAHQGISPEEVIALHSGKTYTVRCLGAPAGSPMMDGPDFPKPVPRLKDPRVSVPAGAVSVAGRQAVIAPAVAPGGWCVIGQTPLRVLDIEGPSLVPYRPGDLLHFEAVSIDEYKLHEGRKMEPKG
ncbi:5-oxoprolinase subunit B family protein [Arthrobacter sp. D2-10]